MTYMNDQGLTNLYESVIFHIQRCFLVPVKQRRVVSTGRNGCRFRNYIYSMFDDNSLFTNHLFCIE